MNWFIQQETKIRRGSLVLTAIGRAVKDCKIFIEWIRVIKKLLNASFWSLFITFHHHVNLDAYCQTLSQSIFLMTPWIILRWGVKETTENVMVTNGTVTNCMVTNGDGRQATGDGNQGMVTNSTVTNRSGQQHRNQWHGDQWHGDKQYGDNKQGTRVSSVMSLWRQVASLYEKYLRSTS